ncbi:MAG: hypothetical protein J7500_07600 [Sphingomonas sp.]|uniref:right-handed parallel beta-helix repeat-containing protein n=1 Tax=Sphingomonas sp. TaxID=28214 RepID=UPI001B0E292B|nr:right-handed parallel beta-helix repeat-containing protein [Sphingomonas sp.]MBO9622562.1 hypothetical protein [Sphingomonas sp.]
MRKSSSRARLFSTCLTGAVLAAASPVWAQTSETPTWKPRAEIDAEAGKSVGVSTALWAPLAQNDSSLVYVDGRIGYDQRFDRNGSATIGARARVGEDFAIGVNAGMDFHRSDLGPRDQAAVSLGLEGFSSVFDVRVNYRMPITKTATISYIDPAAAPSGELTLENNRLIERRSGFRLEDVPLHGFNGEAGARLPVGRNASLRASIGGFDYWDNSADENHRGVRGGLEFDVEDADSGARFTFGGTVERDNRYGTDARATVRLSIPLGGARGDRGAAPTGLDRQMGDRVRRDMVARSGSRFTDLTSDSFAIDARTGQAFGGFYYASGNAAAGAAGTLASPTTLGDAVTRAGANGVVVALGNGGTINTGGVTLATNQYLLGGAGAVDVRLGNGRITSFALGGTNGTIAGTSAATPTIALGQGSVVRDVTVRGAGIGIAANGVGGFALDRVVIENTGGAGLSLTNTLGSVALSGLTIRGGAGAGLRVSGGSSVSVTNSNITGGAGAVDIDDGDANLSVALSNLTLSATAGNVLDIDGSGAGTVTVTGLSGITIAGGHGEDGGLSVRSATFDASTTTAGIQAVNAGRMEVGTTAARVDGPGVFLTDVTGSLSFADLDVANRNATGVQVVNSKVNAFTLTTLDGTVDTLAGTAMDLDPLVIDLNLASVRSVGAAGPGLILDSVQGGGAGGNALTIGNLTLSDSGGDGLVLLGSSGLIRVLGGSITNSGGSAVRVGTAGVAASGGTVGLSFAGTITDPAGGVPLVGLYNFGGAIGFTGAISGSGGIVVQNSLAGSSVNFGAVTLADTLGTAVALDGLAGLVAFSGPLSILNPGGNGIVIGNVPGGVSFGSVVISGLGNAAGLDLSGALGNLGFGSLAITGTGTGTGINLAGSINAGNVLIGGLASIQGVATGVDLTGASMSGIFAFGGGAGSGSVISALTPLLIAGLNEGQGSYNFSGAGLQGDTSNLTGNGFTAYYVLAGATGTGTRNNPGSLAGAEASGAQYIVLLNNAAGGQDVLDAASAGGSFDLAAGQTLVSFLAGDFFATSHGGLPANLIVTGLGLPGITNPFAGSGAALLTSTTAGAATINLADNSAIEGLVVSNATSVAIAGTGTSGVRISNSQIGGAAGAIAIDDGGAAASVTLTNLDLSASGGTVLALSGAGAGTLGVAAADVDIAATGTAAGLALDTVNAAGVAIGSVSVANAAGDAVSIQGATGLPVGIGSVSVTAAAGDGVVISGNSAAVGLGAVSVNGVAGDALRISGNGGAVGIAGVSASAIGGDAVVIAGNNGAVLIGGVTAGGVAGTGLDISDVRAAVTIGSTAVSGASTGVSIDGVQTGTGVAIASLSVAGATGTGVSLANIDGAALFGATSITNPGATGIAFGGGSSGSITFGDTDITGLGAGTRGVDARAASGAVTFHTLDIAGSSAAGTRGIDLTGATFAANFVTTESSHITGVGIGVDLTNAAITGSFRYGDGSSTDADGAASSIVAVTPVVATGMAIATGSYDFRDVVLTGDVSALTSSHTVYFVKAGASGAGTAADPGSLAGAEASAADTIILLNDPTGGNDLLDAASAGGSFDLATGKALLSFLGGDTLTLSGGAPANVLLYGVPQGQIVNPYAGSGAPVLTTSAAGADTLVLGGSNRIEGVRIDNAGGGAGIYGAGVANVSIRASSIAGQSGAIRFIDNGAAANLALNNLLLASSGGNVVDLDGTGAGTLTVTALDGITIQGGNGETGGFVAADVTFDADLATAGTQTVSGAMTVGSASARLEGVGARITGNGRLEFTSLNVTNFNSYGVDLFGNTPFTVFVRSGALDTIDAAALVAQNAALSLNFGSITATDGGIRMSGNVAATAGAPVLNVGTLNLPSGGWLSLSGGAGDYVFANASITNTNGAGAIDLSGMVNLDYAGDITTSGAPVPAISIVGHGGTARFHDGVIDAAGGPGLRFQNAVGTYSFGDVTLSGGAGIAVLSGSSGSLSFGNVDVSGVGAGQTAVDLTGATGNVSFQTLDITGASTAGSKGIDLSGSTTAANIIVSESSTIAGVGTGVDLSNAAITGTFRYGDGSSTDADGAASTIDAATPIAIAGLNAATGSYDFSDVRLVGDTSRLVTSSTTYFVAAGASGAGTMADPGSLAGAETSGAQVIILLNTSTGTPDILDAAGAGGSFDLATGQALLGFLNGDTITLPGGGPANLHLYGLTPGQITNPFAGSGAPVLTNSAAGNTVNLASGAVIDGVRIDASNGVGVTGTGVSGVVIRNSRITGGQGGIALYDGTAAASASLVNLDLSARNDAALLLDGTDTGTLTVRALDGIRVAGGNGESAGILAQGVVFDADGAAAGIQTVTGTLDVGSVAARVGDIGVYFGDSSGDAAFDIDVASTGIGLYAGGGTGGLRFATTGGTIDVAGGATFGVALANVSASVALDSIHYSGTGGGLVLIDVAGVGAGGAAVDVANLTVANGASTAIAMSGTDSGSFSFGAASSIGTTGLSAISLQNSGASVFNFAGSIDYAGTDAAFSAGSGHNGTVNFTGSIDAASGLGLLFQNADGTYDFSGATDLSARIAIRSGSAGSFTFGDVDIDGVGAGQTAVDLTGALGNVSFHTLDITATSAAGSKGIDLTGSATAANIIVSESSTMTGLGVGVDLTNAAIAGAFRYGDGSSTDADGAASSISAVTPLVITGLNGAKGTYDFADVKLTGDTTALQTDKTVYWVQAGAAGAGTRADPGSLAGAEASGADVIILLDTQGAGQDVIDAAGVGGALDLDPNQSLLAFRNGDTVNVGGGAPANLLLFGISGGMVTNPYAGSGAPVLTTSAAGFNTLVLGGGNRIEGVRIDNAGGGAGIYGEGVANIAIRGSAITGQAGAIVLIDNGLTANLALSDLLLASTSGAVVDLDGQGGGTLTVTALDNLTIAGGNGETAGFLATGVLFDSDLVTAGAQAVGGALTIGTSAARVDGDGFIVGLSDGSLDLSRLDVANSNGIGVSITGNVDLGVSVRAGTLDTSTGAALFAQDAALALDFGSVAGTDAGIVAFNTTAADATRDVFHTGALNLTNGPVVLVSAGSWVFDNASITHSDSIGMLIGGATDVDYSGDITSTGTAAATLVAFSHIGAASFHDGTIDVTAGDGLQFIDADGTYSFTGTTTLHGGDAGINVSNDSSGDFLFGAGTSVTNGAVANFVLQDSSANVTYLGSLSQSLATDNFVAFNQSGGTLDFSQATITATAGTGMLFIDADGTNRFGDVALSGGAGIAVQTDSAGTLSFGDVDVTGIGAGQIAVDLTGALGNVSFDTLDISGSGAASKGIDLSGSTTAANIIVSESSTITGVDVGVDLSGAAITGTFRYGDGSNTDADGAASSITATTPLLIGGMSGLTGTYDFADVALTGDTTGLQTSKSVYWVQAGATGAGTRSDPGSLADAEASGADVIVLLDTQGVGQDVIDAAGAGGELDLAANQSLVSFRNADTLNVGGGAPANLLLYGISGGVVTNPYAGSGAPMLTTATAGATTVNLASGVLIDGVVIGNLDATAVLGAGVTGVTIRNSTIHGGATALEVIDNGSTSEVALSNLLLSSGTGNVVSLLGNGGGQLYVTQLANLTIQGGTTGGGLYSDGAIFDANRATAGIEEVVATLSIGSAGSRVGGTGLTINGATGALDLTASVFNATGDGIHAAGGAGGFDFTLAGSIDTGPAAGSGTGLVLSSLSADVQLTSLVYSGLGYGLQAIDVTGIGTGGRAVDVAQLSVAAGAVKGISIRGTSTGVYSFGSSSAIAGTTSMGVELANGGASSFSYLGSITGITSGALVKVSDGHSGSANFTGTLSATGGTGLQFDNADGSYIFAGSATLNGGDAGIDIVNGSAGSFSFNAGTSITNPSGTAISIADSTASLSYAGSITHSSAGNAAISVVNHAGGTLNFQSASFSVTGGTGLAFANSDGTYQFGSFGLSGGAGIAITAGSAGGFTFGDVDVAGLTAGRTALDATGATGNVSFHTLDISAASATGTKGIDLSGSTTAANIIVSESSAMTGLGVGVDLTNAAITGNFRYGDGSSTDLDGAASSISATTPIVIAGLNGVTGTYDFSDVALTGDTSTLQTSTTMFWVQAGATGAGTRSDPGSIADAEASGANAIILIDTQAGAGLSDTITVGGDGTFALDAGQKLLSFLNGDTISLGGGAPGNVLLFGISGGAVTNPFAGSGAPVLTTATAGAPTVQLASNTLIDGVVIASGNMGVGVAGSGALRASLRNSIISGAIGAIDLDDGGTSASVALNHLQLSSTSGIVASFASTGGTFTISALDGVTIAGGNGEGGGFYAQGVTFDADLMAAGTQTVSGTLQIGTAAQRVGGDAFGLDQVGGGLSLDLGLANTGGFGAYVFAAPGGFAFSATGDIDTILGGGGSSALALNGVDADVALTSVAYSGTGVGVLLANVRGAGTGGRAVSIDALTVAAGAGYGIQLTGPSSGDYSFGSGSSIVGTTSAAINLTSSGGATFAYDGAISGITAGALISVGGDNTAASFTGSLATSGGSGLSFANADGSYSFTGTTALNGVGIGIVAGSAGSLTFGSGTSIVDSAGPSILLAGSSATIAYSGSIAQSAAGQPLMVIIGGDLSNAEFTGASVSATGGIGLLAADADGTYTFGDLTLSGGARIAITSGSAGSFTFGDVDIAGLTAGLTAVDLTGALGDVTFDTLDVAGASATGTKGIDLTGNTGAGDILVTNSSAIVGVGVGVDLTNAARTGAFQYGDGEDTIDVFSTINATTPIVITGLNVSGTYNFADVNLVGDTTQLSVNAYFVRAGATGVGTLADPGSIAGADASTAPFIVLLDGQAGAGAFDTITGTLSLADGQTLLSFRDVDSFNVGGGAPANVTVHGITTGFIVNPLTGSGAPLLTSADATGTVQLGGTGVIDGAVISNTGTGAGVYASGTAGTATIRNSTISGGGAGIDIRSGAAARIVNLQNLALANAGNQPGALLNLNGTGGTLTLTGMSGLTIGTAGGETAGLVFNTVTFDSNTATAGIQTVNAGALTIGTAGARVQGDGLSLTNVSGALTFSDLDIANTGGTGLLVANSKANGFLLTTLDGSVDTTGGTAINLDPLSVNITASSVTSSGGAYGILLDQVEGSFTVTGAVTVTNASTAGIAIQDNTGQIDPLDATFNGVVTINTTTGAGLSFTNNGGATISFLGGGLNVNTASGAGLVASTGGTISFAGSGNAIQTGTGRIVDLDGVTAGASGINFATLGGSTSTAPAAIRVNNLDGGAFSGGNTVITGLSGGSDGIWVGGGSASSVSFGNATISGAGGDEGIEINGAGNGAISFSSVTIDNVLGDGVLITGATGSVTIGGGAIGGTGSPAGNGVTVDGGNGAVTINAAVTKASAGRTVEVRNRTGGNLAFGGNLQATGVAGGVLASNNIGGTTITFSGASKTFNLVGTNGVELLNNATSTINFTGGGLGITTTGAGNSLLATNAGTLNITGLGNTIGGGTVSLSGTTVGSAGIEFASVTMSGGGGVLLTNVGTAGGAITLGTVNLQNIASRGIDIGGTLGAALSIADLDIGLTGGSAVALDLNGADLLAAVTVGDFDVTSSAAGSTIAVDLRGSFGGQAVRLGDNAAAGASASISGVNTGVWLDAATNLSFTFGDGEAAGDTGSSISAGTPINASAAPAAGSYDFRDVNFTASPGLGFGIGKTLFVDSDGAAGGGNGSGADGANPMTLAAAEAALAAGDVILLVNNGSAISAAGTNANNTLNLLANNQVRGFGNGPVVLALTVPSTIQLASSTLTITNPNGNGAATLTTSSGADAITLGASGNRISGFILDGTGGALHGIVDNGGATGTIVSDMTIRNFGAGGAYGIEITPSTNTTIDHVTFQNNANDILLNAAGSTLTNVTSTGATGTSITLNNATGTTTLTNVSITGGATGLSFTTPGGMINATNVDISGASSVALAIAGGTASFNFDAASSITQATGGNVVNFTGNHTLGTFAYAGTIDATTGAGMQFSDADGIYNFTGTTTLNGGNAGIDIYNGATGTFAFGAGTTLIHNADANSAFSLLSSANVTFDGAITDNNGRAVEIDGHDAGTATFNGAISSAIGNASTAVSVINSNGGAIVFNGQMNIASATTVVNLSSNDGGTITFNAGGTGLDIASNAGTGMNISGGGTVNVLGSGNSITTTTGTLLNITNTGATTTTANLTFASVNNSGGTNGIFVQRTAGTLNGTTTIASGAITATTRGIALAGDALDLSYGGTITATAGRSFEASSRSGGTVTLSGNIQDNATGILIASNTGGTLNFTGQSIALSTGGSDAITLTNNAGATINFAMAGGGNGLDVTTSSGRGIVASGGGILTIQGAGNSVTTQTGQILGLDGLTVGAAGVTFATLQSTGTTAATAVNLNNVDGGAFAVTGTTSIAGTGVASDGIFIGGGGSSAVSFGATTIGATGDEGIEVNGSGNGVVTFNSVTINGSAGNGVEINGSTNTVNINGGAIGATDDPAGRGIYIIGGTGSVSVAASVNKTSAGAAVEIDGHQTGTVTFTGTITATNGTGLLFTNADGAYNFTGTTTLNGGDAGIDIINGSSGSFAFGDNTSITSPTGAAITVSDSTANLNFSGDVVQANNAAALAVTNHSGGTLMFQTTGSFNVTNGTGFQFNNADGNYTISSANTLNGGDAGIDILAGSDATNGSTGSFAFITNTIITHAGAGNAFTVDSSDASISFGGTITDNNGRAVSINEHDAGTITFAANGVISGSGAAAAGILVQNSNGGTITFNAVNLSTQANAAVTLTNNTGATINFAGGGTGLDIVTTTGAGFTATGGGIISVAGTDNTIAAAGGTALNVQNTTISATGLNFVSISANGGVNGIVLNNTGTQGGLTVGGDAGTTNNSSGGTIQNMTGDGVKLTGVTNVSFDQLNIQNTGLSGIDGTDVTNFAFTNGTINNSGISTSTAGTSNIAFNDVSTGINNLDGTVTVTGSTLTNAYNSGIQIYNESGTISNINISNNTMTASGSTATSKGSGVQIDINGSAGGAAAVLAGTINNNVINKFVSGAGIQFQGGNGSQAAAATLGTYQTTPGTGTIIQIANNDIGLASAGTPLGTNGISVGVTGTGQGNFSITGNEVAHFQGIGISGFGGNKANVSFLVDANTVDAIDNIAGSSGIAVGSQLGGADTTQTGTVRAIISNNNVSGMEGVGILAGITNSYNIGYFKIINNTVGSPTAGAVRSGIRVESGSSVGDATVYLEISGNTSGSIGANMPGISLRKQGSVSGVNEFYIEGLATSPATHAQVEAYVSGQNPLSLLGTGNDGATPSRVLSVSGDQYLSGTVPF